MLRENHSRLGPIGESCLGRCLARDRLAQRVPLEPVIPADLKGWAAVAAVKIRVPLVTVGDDHTQSATTGLRAARSEQKEPLASTAVAPGPSGNPGHPAIMSAGVASRHAAVRLYSAC
jgi:hypothetical protein